MKKILISLLIIVVVIAGAASAMAYFSDTEESTANVFSAGTIDIDVDGSVNGQPFTATITKSITDLKPCETGEITFTVRNVGTNPVVLWKAITDVVTGDGATTEAELLDENGTPNNEIDKVINYDLTAGGNVIYTDADNVTIEQIEGLWMPLGTLEPNTNMEVIQSYHMRGDTGNWAQGDTMTFNITLYAEQRLGSGPQQSEEVLFLDNKSGEPDWYFLADDTWGILSWNAIPVGEFTAQGLTPNTSYSLIQYVDPWPGTVTVLKSGLSDSTGKISWTGGAGNFAMNAYSGKIWLVRTSDVSGGVMSGWNPTSYLFESNLVTIP